jgi:hypothetical protein
LYKPKYALKQNKIKHVHLLGIVPISAKWHLNSNPGGHLWHCCLLTLTLTLNKIHSTPTTFCSQRKPLICLLLHHQQSFCLKHPGYRSNSLRLWPAPASGRLKVTAWMCASDIYAGHSCMYTRKRTDVQLVLWTIWKMRDRQYSSEDECTTGMNLKKYLVITQNEQVTEGYVPL